METDLLCFLVSRVDMSVRQKTKESNLNKPPAYDRLLSFLCRFEYLYLVTLPLQFLIVSLDLFIQVTLLLFQCLDPIADQGAAPESYRTSDRRPRPGMAHCAADDAADRRTANGADHCAFFSRRERFTAADEPEGNYSPGKTG
jgi:hypothetical protein